MADLVGITQIAQRLEKPRNTVDSWRRRGHLPEPDQYVGIHPLWDWKTIESWDAPKGKNR
jgi:hypothetical protein